MLREQLEQAGLANEALSLDIRRLTADWTKAREELEQRESDWRREEEVGVAVRITETQMKNLAQFDACVCSVFPQLLQQRAQPSAGALEAGGGLPQTRV